MLLSVPAVTILAWGLTGPESSAPVPSGAGVRTPVLAPGTGPGAGWVNFPFGMAPEVFLLELHGAVAVFPQRVRGAMEESGVAGRVEMLQLAEQVCLGKILGGHPWHVVLL
jgi:hypothetical protein